MKWNSLLSESSRCLHQEMDIWKKNWFFSPAFTFSDYLQVQRERENLLFFLRKYFHDDTPDYSWCPGENYVKLWLLDPKWTFSPLLFARRPGVVHCADVDGSCFLGHPAADLIANLCEESRSLLCCVMHLGKRKCFVPPPQKRSEKRRKNTPSITMRLGAHRSSLNYTLYNEYGGVCLFVCLFLPYLTVNHFLCNTLLKLIWLHTDTLYPSTICAVKDRVLQILCRKVFTCFHLFKLLLCLTSILCHTWMSVLFQRGLEHIKKALWGCRLNFLFS